MTVDEPEDDADDPLKTVPLTRYNAMLAVVRNTLYMYVFLIHPNPPPVSHSQLRRDIRDHFTCPRVHP